MDKAGEKADNTRFTRMDVMRRKHEQRSAKQTVGSQTRQKAEVRSTL